MSAGSSCVLDASALLALLREEEGAEEVRPRLDGAAISAVNWSEVVARAAARGVVTAGLREDLESLGLSFVPFDADQAERAAELAPATREAGLSLADRACLALASSLALPALTADRAWAELALEIEIVTIR